MTAAAPTQHSSWCTRVILCTHFCFLCVVWSAVCIHWSVSWFRLKPTDSNECWVQPSVFSVGRDAWPIPTWGFSFPCWIFEACVCISLKNQPLRIHIIIDNIDNKGGRFFFFLTQFIIFIVVQPSSQPNFTFPSQTPSPSLPPQPVSFGNHKFFSKSVSYFLFCN